MPFFQFSICSRSLMILNSTIIYIDLMVIEQLSMEKNIINAFLMASRGKISRPAKQEFIQRFLNSLSMTISINKQPKTTPIKLPLQHDKIISKMFRFKQNKYIILFITEYIEFCGNISKNFHLPKRALIIFLKIYFVKYKQKIIPHVHIVKTIK